MKIGDRVTASPFHPCRACVYCRMAKPNLRNSTRTAGVNTNGSFAEYVKVEYSNAIVLPALETLTSDKHVLFSWLAPYTWNEAL